MAPSELNMRVKQYRLVCSLNSRDVLLQTFLWTLLVIVTVGVAIPLFRVLLRPPNHQPDRDSRSGANRMTDTRSPILQGTLDLMVLKTLEQLGHWRRSASEASRRWIHTTSSCGRVQSTG